MVRGEVEMYENQTMRGKGKRKETRQTTIAIIQGREKNDSYMHRENGGFEMWLDSRCILKIETQFFFNILR